MNVLARARSAVSTGLWAHLPSLFLLAVFIAASLILLDETDEQVSFHGGSVVDNLLRLLPFFLICAGMIRLFWLAVTPRRDRSLGGALRWVSSHDWPEILLLRIPLGFGLITLTSYLYTTFKVNIANFAPYTWDHFFAGIDRALFLGLDPWVLSHRLMPGVGATVVLDTLYTVWFLVIQLSIFVIALMPLRHPLRLTFLFAFVLNWMVAGVTLAILFPAAGPVYMERLTGDAMFQPLMEQLYRQTEITAIMALETQEWLWQGYSLADVEPVGISAFPSMHLMAATTCACFGFALNRALGWLLAAFTAAMLVGSVHLGWHYAIDGFAGIVLAIVSWWISARVTRWWLARTGPGATVAAENRPERAGKPLQHVEMGSAGAPPPRHQPPRSDGHLGTLPDFANPTTEVISRKKFT